MSAVGRFEVIVSLLGVVIGMLTTLVAVIWKARGWADQLNETDRRQAEAIDKLATATGQQAAAIDKLAKTMARQHAETERRLRHLERRGVNPISRKTVKPSVRT